jgi:hypothetical protein
VKKKKKKYWPFPSGDDAKKKRRQRCRWPHRRRGAVNPVRRRGSRKEAKGVAKGHNEVKNFKKKKKKKYWPFPSRRGRRRKEAKGFAEGYREAIAEGNANY